MKKIVIAVLICVVLLAGCNKTLKDIFGSGESSESSYDGQEAVKLNKDTKYCNDYLGISYTIPKGWWLYDVDEDNFGESGGEITSDVSMDLEYGKYDNYSYINAWLVSFGNLKESTQDNHLGFSLDARSLEGINDMAGYMKYFEIFMLEPTDTEDYKLLDSQKIDIKGKSFEVRDYLVSRKEDDFHVVTFCCQVKQGFFFNISVDYWPDNTKAKQTIIDCITKGVEFY